MTTLLDVSVLIAIFVAEHAHHESVPGLRRSG